MFTNLSNSTKALLFFVIAFVLTLTSSLMVPILGEMTALIHTFTPIVSVLIMMLVITRDGYSKTGWAAIGLHRLGGLRFWMLAFLGPAVLMGVLYIIAWVSPVGQFVVAEGFSWALLATNLSSGLVLAVVFGLCEEIGFRGYALPHLLHLGPTQALLRSGLMFALWHFPLLLLTPVYPILGSWLITGPILLLTLTFGGVFYGYLRLGSKSLWPPALAHGVINTSFVWFALFTTTTSPLALEYMVGETGLLTLLATAGVASVIIYWLRRRPGTLGEKVPASA